MNYFENIMEDVYNSRIHLLLIAIIVMFFMGMPFIDPDSARTLVVITQSTLGSILLKLGGLLTLAVAVFFFLHSTINSDRPRFFYILWGVLASTIMLLLLQYPTYVNWAKP